MWKVHYYTNEKGKCETAEFINSLDKKEQAKILAFISQLSTKGPNLKRPRADKLVDKIYELRIPFSKNQYRILYFFVFKDHIILTHGFLKKTKSVPKSQIEKANKIRIELEARFKDKSSWEEYINEKS